MKIVFKFILFLLFLSIVPCSMAIEECAKSSFAHLDKSSNGFVADKTHEDLEIVDIRQEQVGSKAISTTVDLINFDEDEAKVTLGRLSLSDQQLSYTWERIQDALKEHKKILVVITTDPESMGIGKRVKSISNRLRNQVLQFAEMEDLQNKISEINSMGSDISWASFEASNTEKQMRWMEKRLPLMARFLGGDARKIEQYKTAKKKQAHLIKLLPEKTQDKDNAEQAVQDRIRGWIFRHDERLAKLGEIKQELSSIVKRGNALLSISNNLHWTDDKRKFMGEARDYLSVIQQFKQKLDRLISKAENADKIEDELLDLIFDYAIFYPLDALNLQSLESHEPNSYVKNQISKIVETMKGVYSKIELELDQIVEEVLKMAIPSNF